ncbi:hypothetical protein K438DRAFT_40081 [Mycena galopus ATCC 62051]|nr:hypothetical protein K438DRAFT_40081 [Mycena galopus ATCC 62051]
MSHMNRIQFIDTATSSSTMDVDSHSSGLQCPGHLVHSAPGASGLNKHGSEQNALRIQRHPHTSVNESQAGGATSSPKKGELFSSLRQSVQVTGQNINLAVLYHNIAPSLPLKDWAEHRSPGTVAFTEALQSRVKTDPKHVDNDIGKDYNWELGNDVQNLLNSNPSLLGTPAKSPSNSKIPTTKSPSVSSSAQRIKPTHHSTSAEATFPSYSPPPPAINSARTSNPHIPRDPRRSPAITRNTPTSPAISPLIPSSPAITRTTPSSPATTNCSSPDLGSRRGWSEFSGFSNENDRFSPATTPPLSPVAERDNTLRQREVLKYEDVLEVLSEDDESGVYAEDMPVVSEVPETHGDFDYLGDYARATSTAAKSYMSDSSGFGDAVQAQNLFDPDVVAESYVPEYVPDRKPRTIIKQHTLHDFQDPLHLQGNLRSRKLNFPNRRRQPKSEAEPKPKPGQAQVRAIPSSFLRVPTVRQASSSRRTKRPASPERSRSPPPKRQAQRKPKPTPVQAQVRTIPSSLLRLSTAQQPSSSRGVKRRASQEHLTSPSPPPKRQATTFNAVRTPTVVVHKKAAIKLTEAIKVKWEGELRRFEQLVFDGKTGAISIVGLVKFLQAIEANIDGIDAEWVMKTLRTREVYDDTARRGKRDEYKTKLEFLELIVEGYEVHDEDGEVALHAAALLDKWRRFAANAK